VIHVELTAAERDLIVVALRALEDRVCNGAFDFHLEPEFAQVASVPGWGDVLALSARLGFLPA
jgi:hypothetical protein